MKKNTSFLTFINEIIVMLVLTTYTILCVYGNDPSPLQDFCVAADHPKNTVYVNGKFCKNPKKVKADDFYFNFDIPNDINRLWGYNATVASAYYFPGLNTLGVSAARVDYAVKGLVPLHSNYVSEIILVDEGTLYVGFVTSNEYGNRLFAKTLKKGDLFVFPKGLIHFQINVGDTPAISYNAWGSQNPGYIVLPNVLFGSSPRINSSVLAKSFQLHKDFIAYLLKKSWPRTSKITMA